MTPNETALIPTTNPFAVLARYLDRPDADPSKLTELARLVEWHENREAERAFSRAMNDCQKELPCVVKDADNSRTGKKYAKIETIQEAIRTAILKNGLSLSWSQGEPPAEGMTRVTCVLSHIGGASKHYQGDYPIDGKGAKGGAVMNDLQGVVSAHTYAQRDMLRMMFNITIGDRDRDGESNGNGLITPDQIGVINDLLRACEEAGHGVKDMEKFLCWAINCEPPKGDEPALSLAEIPAKRFTDVCANLTRRRTHGPSKAKEAKGASK